LTALPAEFLRHVGLEPDKQFSKNIIQEALVARVACQPVHNLAVEM
jgi:hypothetical protein